MLLTHRLRVVLLYYGIIISSATPTMHSFFFYVNTFLLVLKQRLRLHFP